MLALQFGYPDVEKLKRVISSRQFALWKIFYDVRPFGDEWTDNRFAHQTEMLWTSFRGSDERPHQDLFFPIIYGRDNSKRGRKSAEEMAAMLQGAG